MKKTLEKLLFIFKKRHIKLMLNNTDKLQLPPLFLNQVQEANDPSEEESPDRRLAASACKGGSTKSRAFKIMAQEVQQIRDGGKRGNDRFLLPPPAYKTKTIHGRKQTYDATRYYSKNNNLSNYHSQKVTRKNNTSVGLQQ